METWAPAPALLLVGDFREMPHFSEPLQLPSKAGVITTSTSKQKRNPENSPCASRLSLHTLTRAIPSAALCGRSCRDLRCSERLLHLPKVTQLKW